MKKNIWKSSGLIPLLLMPLLLLAQPPKEKTLLKSEFEHNAWGEWSDNLREIEKAPVIKPHTPVFFSTDKKNKHIIIQVSNPDNGKLNLLVSDSTGNVVYMKNFRCKPRIKVSTRHFGCDCYTLSLFHYEGGILMASQEIRKDF